jgi:hypothetical protein
MKRKRTKSKCGVIGRLRVIEDFLPPPNTLVPRDLAPPHPEEGAKRPSRRMGRPHGLRRAASRRSSP